MKANASAMPLATGMRRANSDPQRLHRMLENYEPMDSNVERRQPNRAPGKRNKPSTFNSIGWTIIELTSKEIAKLQSAGHAFDLGKQTALGLRLDGKVLTCKDSGPAEIIGSARENSAALRAEERPDHARGRTERGR